MLDTEITSLKREILLYSRDVKMNCPSLTPRSTHTTRGLPEVHMIPQYSERDWSEGGMRWKREELSLLFCFYFWLSCFSHLAVVMNRVLIIAAGVVQKAKHAGIRVFKEILHAINHLAVHAMPPNKTCFPVDRPCHILNWKWTPWGLPLRYHWIDKARVRVMLSVCRLKVSDAVTIEVQPRDRKLMRILQDQSAKNHPSMDRCL